jgi:hypothetical protein
MRMPISSGLPPVERSRSWLWLTRVCQRREIARGPEQPGAGSEMRVGVCNHADLVTAKDRAVVGTHGQRLS